MYRGNNRNIAIGVVLSIITCSIYLWIWMYQIMTDLKAAKNDSDINPGLEIFLCIITCHIYTIYWGYKYGKKVAETQAIYNAPIEDNSIAYLILGIFQFNIISVCLLQNSLNKLWDNTSGYSGY
jgi:TRAP-type C4-dicarboxylate transport system permease small subunit